MYSLQTAYHIIEVPLTSNIRNIQRFSEKIPADFVLVTGFRAVVKKTQNFVAGMPNAVVSVSFNNKLSNPIPRIAAEKSIGIVKKATFKFWSLAEQNQDNTYLEGYVDSDSTGIVGDYSVKIILRGKRIYKPLNTVK